MGNTNSSANLRDGRAVDLEDPGFVSLGLVVDALLGELAEPTAPADLAAVVPEPAAAAPESSVSALAPEGGEAALPLLCVAGDCRY